MSEGADIPIHIIIRQEGAEDVANKIEALTQKLTELTMQSEALQRPLRSISRSFNSLTRGVDSSFESLDRSMMVIARNIDVIENFTDIPMKKWIAIYSAILDWMGKPEETSRKVEDFLPQKREESP